MVQQKGLLIKERSASQSKLLLLPHLVDGKTWPKSPLGSEHVRSGASSPRLLPPINDLQQYFEKIEEREEKAIKWVLKQLDDPVLDNFLANP